MKSSVISLTSRKKGIISDLRHSIHENHDKKDRITH